jgi:threonyl-tRNA synthetase
MAQAVADLFPGAMHGTGPALKDSFYYDMRTEPPITEADLPRIEDRMREIIAGGSAFVQKDLPRVEAEALFSERGQDFKIGLIEKINEDSYSTYSHDDGGFVDLCRGPHVKDTKSLRFFKLMSVSSAYWQADPKNPQLSRVYGTVWESPKELKLHLRRIEEARKRDHRKLGKEMGLFTFFPFSPGSPVLLSRGMVIYRLLGDRIRELVLGNGYQEVRGPIMCHQSLWERSGHWEAYKEHMFLLGDEHDDGSEGSDKGRYSLKPMNCPVHMSIFGMERRSYRELPIRYHDEGPLHRNELKGALGGITRTRSFCQDDSHHFVREQQIGEEIQRILNFVDRVYSTFDMKVTLELSTRPEKALGDLSLWEQAEAALQEQLEASGKPWKLNPGDGAFYGPKIDFHVEDALGRTWQLATCQLDFVLPERFDLTYQDEQDKACRPVVMHVAMYGSFERFLAVLIEHTGGAFPFWLHPEQVAVVSVSQDWNDYGEEVVQALRKVGIRASLDGSSDKVNAKIARATKELRAPAVAVIGGREAEERTISLRLRGEGPKGSRPLDEFVNWCVEQNDVHY